MQSKQSLKVRIAQRLRHIAKRCELVWCRRLPLRFVGTHVEAASQALRKRLPKHSGSHPEYTLAQVQINRARPAVCVALARERERSNIELGRQQNRLENRTRPRPHAASAQVEGPVT